MSEANELLFLNLRQDIDEVYRDHWGLFGDISTTAYSNAYERQAKLLSAVKSAPLPQSLGGLVFTVVVGFAGGALAGRLLRGLSPTFTSTVSTLPANASAVSLKTASALVSSDAIVADWFLEGMSEGIHSGVQGTANLLQTARAASAGDSFEPAGHKAIVEDKIYSIGLRRRTKGLSAVLRFLQEILKDGPTEVASAFVDYFRSHCSFLTEAPQEPDAATLEKAMSLRLWKAWALARTKSYWKEQAGDNFSNEGYDRMKAYSEILNELIRSGVPKGEISSRMLWLWGKSFDTLDVYKLILYAERARAAELALEAQRNFDYKKTLVYRALTNIQDVINTQDVNREIPRRGMGH